MVDEDEANAVDKKLNESSVLQDAVMAMVIVVEAIMKLTLVMQMMVDKEVSALLHSVSFWSLGDETRVQSGNPLYAGVNSWRPLQGKSWPIWTRFFCKKDI